MDEDSGECPEYTDREEIIFEKVDQLLTIETEEELNPSAIWRPMKCVLHTLNLVDSNIKILL